MKLAEESARLFFRLYISLLFYAGRMMDARGIGNIDAFANLSKEKKMEIRNKMLENIHLIDSFVAENPFNFNPEEIAIVRGWKNFVKGEFFVVEYVEGGALFLQPAKKPKAYCVLALNDPFEKMTNGVAPLMVEAVLLPFKGRIVADGMISAMNISFGDGIRKVIESDYNGAKEEGVISSFSSESGDWGKTLDDETVYVQKKELQVKRVDETTLNSKQIKIGRNGPCPCGSGKKHKKCCLNKAAE